MDKKNNILEQFAHKAFMLENTQTKNRLFNNRYILKDKIGEGGLCKVYDAIETYSEYFKEDRNLVVKVPLQELLDKKDIAAFVYSEYSILSKVCHPNIVRVTDFGIDESSEIPYLVMEKLDGTLLVNLSLHQIDKAMTNKLTYSLYKALLYLHTKQIVHADINPTNIMVLNNGQASLFDFGISQDLYSQKSFHLSFSKMNAFNPIYSAPEILEGKKPSSQTDIFSLACVLYELYSGKLPFIKSSLELKATPLKQKDFCKIPLLQRTWFRKALVYDPNKRVKSIPLYVKLKMLFDKCIVLSH